MFKWILGLLVGCSALAILPTIPPKLVWLGLLASSIASLLLSRRTEKPLLQAFLLLFSGFLFGLGWSLTHASWRLSAQIPAPENNSVHIIEAVIDSLPVIYPEYCQFRIKVEQTDSEALLNKQLLLKDYSSQCEYQLGDKWLIQVKLKPIYGPVNQAGFDYERYIFQQGLDGKGYIKSSSLLEPANTYSISSLRQTLFEKLKPYTNSGLLQALVIGEKSGIPLADKELLRQLGLSHLVAISGLHISIMAGLGFWLLYQCLGFSVLITRKKFLEPYRIALLASCLVAALYSALADFSIPTVRALIMWCCVALLAMSQRQGALLSGLKLALFIILLIDPLSVLSPGFWMSFTAVVVISFMLVGRVKQQVQGLKRWRDALYQLIKLQIGITLLLVLPSLLIFGEANFSGLLVNIVVIPVFSVLLLPAIILAVVLSLMGSDWLLHIIDNFMSKCLAWARDSLEPMSHFLKLDGYFEPWLLISLFVVGLLLLLPLGRLRAPLLPLACLFVLQGFVPNYSQQPRAIVFDVSHGLAVLLTDGKHHILYDTGYAANEGSAFESYIYPSLKKLGIHHLDALILSHKDNDHSGGAKDVVTKLPVKELVVGHWSQSSWFSGKAAVCETGYSQTIGTFHIKAIYPNSSSDGTNNDSCVISVKSADLKHSFSLLLTGDIEKEAEYELAERLGKQLESNILIAPHHGSNSSSTYPFLKMVNPQETIYSTERYSRYRLPHHKVIRRYSDFGIKQLHTGCLGQITINLADNHHSYERHNQRIWRKQACSVDTLKHIQ
ncbi:DNA internalization-related competence protein ComEC/Rec2 [Kangiella spongicola]|uniref:DNA internalization-related competence protein ComEC/Rec2 n=1 Tax=Kangiella spongicola TaxID=796379 RepID=A0A318D0Q3_9GAMM|nr:DNA internalization-related competence protein ComEC/Rec2 [Kangiella spongicola]PXF62802.1 DNA internalization-related competence protein ComEC/Rec2 [Kangiella spongicola]